jgi:hypothetical protein
MANYKRKRKYSKIASKCTICAGQRRTFGAGNCKMRAKLKAMEHDNSC